MLFTLRGFLTLWGLIGSQSRPIRITTQTILVSQGDDTPQKNQVLKLFYGTNEAEPSLFLTVAGV